MLQQLLQEPDIVNKENKYQPNNSHVVSLPIFYFEHIINFLFQSTTEPQPSTAPVSLMKGRTRKPSAIAQENAKQKAIAERHRKKRRDHRTSQTSHRIYAARKRFELGLQENP